MQSNEARPVFVCWKIQHSHSMLFKVSNKVWLTVSEDGTISNAHCTCMAGQGSVCSHVGAILFYVHGVAEFKERKTPPCTSELCSWLPPSLKKVDFAAVKQIQFSAPARRFTSMISGNGGHTQESKAQLERQQSRDAVPVLSSDELHSFLADIKVTGIKSAVLQTHQAFCDDSIHFLQGLSLHLHPCMMKHLLHCPTTCLSSNVMESSQISLSHKMR